MSHQWQQRNRPLRLERRYEFQDYSALRDFLDKAADISEQEGYYPDMGFGRDYVNITIHVNGDDDALGEHQHRIAQQLDTLAEAIAH